MADKPKDNVIGASERFMARAKKAAAAATPNLEMRGSPNRPVSDEELEELMELYAPMSAELKEDVIRFLSYQISNWAPEFAERAKEAFEGKTEGEAKRLEMSKSTSADMYLVRNAVVSMLLRMNNWYHPLQDIADEIITEFNEAEAEEQAKYEHDTTPRDDDEGDEQ